MFLITGNGFAVPNNCRVFFVVVSRFSPKLLGVWPDVVSGCTNNDADRNRECVN